MHFYPPQGHLEFSKIQKFWIFFDKIFFWLDTHLKVSNIDLTVNFTLEGDMWGKKIFFFGEIGGGSESGVGSDAS